MTIVSCRSSGPRVLAWYWRQHGVEQWGKPAPAVLGGAPHEVDLLQRPFSPALATSPLPANAITSTIGSGAGRKKWPPLDLWCSGIVPVKLSQRSVEWAVHAVTTRSRASRRLGAYPIEIISHYRQGWSDLAILAANRNLVAAVAMNAATTTRLLWLQPGRLLRVVTNRTGAIIRTSLGIFFVTQNASAGPAGSTHTETATLFLPYSYRRATTPKQVAR